MDKTQEAKLGAIYFALICGTVLGWKALDVSHPAPAPIAAPVVQYVPMGKPAPVDYGPATIPETSPDADDILGATSYPDAKASKSHREHKERSHKESSTTSTTSVVVRRFTSNPAPTKAERSKASKPETYKVPKGPTVGGVR